MSFTILRRVFVSRSTANSLMSSRCSRLFSASRRPTSVVDDGRRSVADRIQLSPLFQEPGDDRIKDWRIELVDDATWNMSSSLADAWRGSNGAAASGATSCFSDDECDFGGDDDDDDNENLAAKDGHDFDDIEDMRIRGNLFYKLERSSKEYEEYKFDFHGSKTTRNEREQRRIKEERKKGNPSKVEMTSKKNHAREIERNEDESKQVILLASETREKPNPRLREMRGARSTIKIEERAKEAPSLALASKLETASKNNSTREIKKSGDDSKKAVFLASDRLEKPNPWHQEAGDARFVKNKRTPTFNQLTAAYHEPFCLDVYISKGSIRASIIHRATSNVVVVAHSISKDMKFDLGSTKNKNACATVGKVLAQRALDDDIHNVVYTPRKGERIEGKLQIVVKSIVDGGVDVKVKLKQRSFKHAKHPQPLEQVTSIDSVSSSSSS